MIELCYVFNTDYFNNTSLETYFTKRNVRHNGFERIKLINPTCIEFMLGFFVTNTFEIVSTFHRMMDSSQISTVHKCGKCK